jgi:hypothetical protein
LSRLGWQVRYRKPLHEADGPGVDR